MHLHHISLVSGLHAVHRLDLLDPVKIESFRTVCPAGGRLPDLDGFSTCIRGEMMTIYRGSDPVILCALGVGRTHAWNVLQAFQETFCPVKVQPPGAQWLGVVELPSLGKLSWREHQAMADCERYLAGMMLLPRVPGSFVVNQLPTASR